MADKTFHSIKFPGLPDTYKIPDIVKEYSTSSAYAIGDYVLKDGKTYKCTTAIASSGETWNTAHWTEIKVGNDLQGEIADLKSAFDQFEGISDEVKDALLECFSKVLYSTEDGETSYEKLHDAFYLLLKIPNNTVFDGTAADVVITDEALLQKDSSFTVIGECTFNFSTNWENDQNFFLVRGQSGDFALSAGVNKNHSRVSVVTFGSSLNIDRLIEGSNTVKFAITHAKDSNKFYVILDVNGITDQRTFTNVTFTPSTNVLVVGASYNSKNPDTNYNRFIGTMTDFSVLSRALSYSEIDKYMNTLYTLPADTVFDGTKDKTVITDIQLYKKDISFTMKGTYTIVYNGDENWTNGNNVFVIRSDQGGWTSTFGTPSNGTGTSINVLGKYLKYNPKLSIGKHTIKFLISHVANSGTYSVMMSVDGTMQQDTLTPTAFVPSTNVLVIGATYTPDHPNANYGYFNGIMHDFTVLSRALTNEEATAYMSA